MNTKDMTKNAIFAAVYCALTVAFGAASYGPFQFRLSVMLIPISFYNRKLVPGAIFGVAIANLFSPLGPIDLLIGLGIQGLSALFNRLVDNAYLTSVFQGMTTAVLVSLGLQYAMNIPALTTIVPVLISNTTLLLISSFVISKKFKHMINRI